MDRAFRNDPPTVGQWDAVRPILPEYDRVGGVRGYAGTGKTVPVLDEGSLASTREVRELLRIADVLPGRSAQGEPTEQGALTRR